MKNTKLTEDRKLEAEIKDMRVSHLPEVLAIEKLSFSRPCSKDCFIHELLYNKFSYYAVALIKGLSIDESHCRNRTISYIKETVLGYGGMWLILDEVHITSLAVHPEYRNFKIGFNLMQHLLSVASLRGGSKATLEVRVSNEPARKLYEKLGFVEIGVRKNYYQDTKEDAIIMWKYDIERK